MEGRTENEEIWVKKNNIKSNHFFLILTWLKQWVQRSMVAEGAQHRELSVRKHEQTQNTSTWRKHLHHSMLNAYIAFRQHKPALADIRH